GPNSSRIRPRGSPLPPSARSSDRAPVEIPSTSRWLPSPSFMIAPAPNDFSIELIALFSARSSAVWADLASPPPCRLATAVPPNPNPRSGLYTRTLAHQIEVSEVKARCDRFRLRGGHGRGGRRRAPRG